MQENQSSHGNSFLTERQREIMRLRKQNLKKSEIARILNITRQDVTILEKRAKMNIEKAFNTIQIAYEDGLSVRHIIMKNTQILDAVKEILDAGNWNNIKIRSSIPEIFSLMRACHGSKIKNGVISDGTEVSILPDGTLIMRPFVQ